MEIYHPMNETTSLTRQLGLIKALQFVSYMTMVLIATYFPLYFYSLGFTKLQIGAVYSVGPVLSIVSNVLAGLLSDKTKSLRRVITLLFAGQILALALLLPLKEFGILSAVMALFYLFQTAVNPMLDSLSLLAADRTKRSFASIRVFGSLGYAFSAVSFGLLLKIYGSNMTIVFALGTVSASMLISLLVSDFQASIRKFGFGGLWQIVRRPATLGFFAAVMILSVAHRVNEGFLAIAMRDQGASDFVIGIAMLASSVSEIPIFFLLAKYGHRYREFALLTIASAMYMIRLTLLSITTAPWGFVAIQMLHSVSYGIFYITALRCLQSMIPEEYRSSGQAMFAVAWTGIAGVIAGMLGGWLFDAYGLAVLFRVGSFFALAGGTWFLFFHLRRIAP